MRKINEFCAEAEDGRIELLDQKLRFATCGEAELAQQA